MRRKKGLRIWEFLHIFCKISKRITPKDLMKKYFMLKIHCSWKIPGYMTIILEKIQSLKKSQREKTSDCPVGSRGESVCTRSVSPDSHDNKWNPATDRLTNIDPLWNNNDNNILSQAKNNETRCVHTSPYFLKRTTYILARFSLEKKTTLDLHRYEKSGRENTNETAKSKVWCIKILSRNEWSGRDRLFFYGFHDYITE
jgi:hypothetical protein